jgi:hypothetical protein
MNKPLGFPHEVLGYKSRWHQAQEVLAPLEIPDIDYLLQALDKVLVSLNEYSDKWLRPYQADHDWARAQIPAQADFASSTMVWRDFADLFLQYEPLQASTRAARWQFIEEIARESPF